MSNKKQPKRSKNKQQKIFGRTNPLEERLGTGFFDQLPRKPGIYKMVSRTDEILYVGKPKIYEATADD